MRRTHGIEAGLAVARLSSMVGFAATSNVEAARRYGIAAAGTMAHSYVEAFNSERQAFTAFAQDFPNRTTFLVDTYDTLHGIRQAIGAIKGLGLSENLAIRIDSGDFARITHRARRMLDDSGMGSVRIIVSGGLDELEIDELVRGGAPIDAFGVGTRMGVSADQPYLDTAYKLVSIDRRPVMKLSAGKATQPRPKQVFRRPTPLKDVVGLRTEKAPAGFGRLLEPVMRHGKRISTAPSLAESRLRFEQDLALLPARTRDLSSPRSPVVGVTRALRTATASTRARLRRARLP
jgi:nicotinate phosphoribosyltransferase